MVVMWVQDVKQKHCVAHAQSIQKVAAVTCAKLLMQKHIGSTINLIKEVQDTLEQVTEIPRLPAKLLKYASSQVDSLVRNKP